MKLPALRYETRRRKELRAEIVRRARLWLPEWRSTGDSSDVADAIFEIAARLESEVTQRLDRFPEKAFRGFADWLGVRGSPGHVARLPIVMKMASGSEPVLVDAPAQVQADAGGKPVIFETSEPLQLTPANLAAVVAAAPDLDQFYVGPLTSYKPPKPMPDAWRLASDVPAGAIELQLDPPVGLTPGVTLSDAAGWRYRVVAAKDGLIAIEPGLEAACAAKAVFSRVVAFEPFKAERGDQQHAFYVGSTTALDLTFPATIGVSGVGGLANHNWCFWGKKSPSGIPEWVPLEPKASAEGVALSAPTLSGATFDIKTVGESFKSRWLRATPKAAVQTAVEVSDLQLAINCPSPGIPAALTMVGVANTAPLVLSQPFYPLGQAPRQFDAFYLGCEEAFSKANAEVSIHITTGGGFSAPLAAVRLPPWVFVVGLELQMSLAAGVGNDGKLHLVQTIQQIAAGVTQPGDPFFPDPVLPPPGADGRAASLLAGYRVGAAVVGDTAHFSVASTEEVWLWSRSSNPTTAVGDWRSLGAPASENPKLGDTFVTSSGNGRDVLVYAISGKALYRRTAPGAGAWEPVNVGGSVDTEVARIVPILRAEAAPGTVDHGDGLVVVGVDGTLYSRQGNELGIHSNVVKVDPAIYPLVVSTPPLPGAVTQTRPLLVFSRALPPPFGAPDLIAFDLRDPTTTMVSITRPMTGRAFGFGLRSDGVLMATLVADEGTTRRLALWAPFDAEQPFLDRPAPGLFDAPVPLGGRQLAPLGAGAVTYGDINPDLVEAIPDAVLGFAALVDHGDPWLGARNLLVEATRLHRVFDVEGVSDLGGQRAALRLVDGVDSNLAEPVRIYRGKHPDRACGVRDRKTLVLELNDTAQTGDLLYVSWPSGYRFVSIRTVALDPVTHAPVAELDANLPTVATTAPTASYRNIDTVAGTSIDTKAALRPTVTTALQLALFALNPDQVQIEFDQGASQGLLASVQADGLLVLAAPWSGPAPTTAFGVAAFRERVTFDPPRPRNPELSWEFWDGSSWWQIPGVKDGTANLVTEGVVSFCVPPGLQATDVVGRNARWIRARLVGGDYGQEDVRLDGQKVVRDTSTIHAPYVIKLAITYTVCCPVRPEWVLTEDNGGVRDQTAASRTANAHVDVFTPLATALGAAPAAPVDPAVMAAAAKAEAFDCGDPVPPTAAPAIDDSGGRALYLGFDQTLQGAGVSLLFLVEDTDLEAAFPLIVEGFSNGKFIPVPSEDGTRGLGETGILTLSFSEPLQQAAFFGQAQFWLRLRPNPRFVDQANWTPRIRGIYLNAAWATAAETQTNELLGSSDGSPGQRLILARPPIVEPSLVLRVRELLGDEDIAALRADDPTAVVDQIGPWPGPWVRWTRAASIAAGPMDRVYELDAATGEVSFGTGVHGRIPPVGRDNIAAERYQAGGGAAANSVGAWSHLNLITPVQGVEATIAPEGAAGGADPQDAAAVLRFSPAHLAMRERAVTLRDFEHLAMESSPRVAQARAFTSGRGVLVVAIMTGRDPLPSNSDRREMRSTLLAAASPALAASGALTVEAPVPVAVAITLDATVADLAVGARVAAVVIDSLQALLDPATGGLDGLGWRLGDMLTETDVAARLRDVRDLENFTVAVSRADGRTAPLNPNELLTAPPDGIRVTCQAAAETVG